MSSICNLKPPKKNICVFLQDHKQLLYFCLLTLSQLPSWIVIHLELQPIGQECTKGFKKCKCNFLLIDAIDTRRSTTRSNKVILWRVMSLKKSNTTHGW